MIEAHTITLELGGHWYGQYGTAPCPVCQPERRLDQNALTLCDGADKLLVHCKKLNCRYQDILFAAGLRSGDFAPPDEAIIAQRKRQQKIEAERRSAQAKRLWSECLPISGSIAETYLRRRGIACDLASTLRFHGHCWHGPTAKCYAALVALVEGSSGFAVHRTYLREDGSGKASLNQEKLLLGASSGGSVRLANGSGPLIVGEGIETTLSAFILLGEKNANAWAALSSSALSGLQLPRLPDKLIIASDSDDSGAGSSAAKKLADKANAAGWSVMLWPAPSGMDWNDVLVKSRGVVCW